MKLQITSTKLQINLKFQYSMLQTLMVPLFRRNRLCRNWQNCICCCIVIPGLTRNPVLFQGLTFLDAGSGLPSTRLGVRHDGQNLSAFLNFGHCDLFDICNL